MTALIGSWGALGVFCLMVPESACIPVPSEMTLMCAGFGVGVGWMPFWLAVLAASAGNLCGSLLAYGFGRLAAARGHRPRVLTAVAICEPLFERRGERAVFLARLMPLARTFVSLPAGYAGVPLVPFITLTGLGCTIWAGAFILLGLLAGSGWERLSGPLGYALLGVTVLGIFCAWLWRRVRKCRGS